MKKLYTLMAVVLLASMLLAACSPAATPTEVMTEAPASSSSSSSAASSGGAPDCTKPEVFCVGFVTDVGKIDDKSFNQTAWEGVEKAKSDGSADWVQYIETTDSKDYDKNIATFADAGYDVNVTWGFALTDATYNAAKKYPNIFFVG